jgi:hypothetical protein
MTKDAQRKIIDPDGNEVGGIVGPVLDPDEVLPPKGTEEERVDAPQDGRRGDRPGEYTLGAASVYTDGKGGFAFTMEFTPQNVDLIQRGRKCPRCGRHWPHTGVCHNCEQDARRERARTEAYERSLDRIARFNADVDAAARAARQLPPAPGE